MLNYVSEILVIFITQVSGITLFFSLQETINFFMAAYGKSLSVDGQLEFLNMWYIMIIINDVLIIMGSAIKEQIEKQVCGMHFHCLFIKIDKR